MTAPLRVGLVGAGMVAAHHVAAWAACPSARLVGVADPDIARAHARAPDGARAFKSLAEMIAACEPDAVDIASPPPTHAALIAEAQAAGLHVLCQKPLAPDAKTARAIEAALRPASRVMLHENWRWRPPYQALKQALEAGLVPRPARVAFEVASAGLLPDAEGRLPALVRQPFMARLPRLLVFELMIHHLDVLRFLFGEIEILSARLARRCDAVAGEDRAEIALTAGGVAVTLAGDLARPGAPPLPRDRLWMDGTLRVDGWRLALPGAPTRSWEHVEGYQTSYDATIAHFVTALAQDLPFATTVADGRTLLELVDEVYRIAAWTGAR